MLIRAEINNQMAKTYLQRYGLEAVKKHLKKQYTSRYHKIGTDYANGGITIFNYKRFAWDLGIGFSEFPFKKSDHNGWHLHDTPTIEELEEFLSTHPYLYEEKEQNT